ncbi:MAG: 2-dehydropantoate 2-reductase [Alphaproteobacteria bacterium]|jgi:2-dehydropantoate 2-reductase|nr:2-dehydropantoate 2-reductase [Alphaproteobacteria bacterium]
MKFAILGAGAVAGYFGARLDAAGEDVTHIARGAHLEAIRSSGLRVESANGDLHIDPAKATDDPAEIGPVDYVIFAVKLFDTEASGAMAKPLLGPGTTVVTLQNGVESVEVLSGILGAEHVMGGTAYISSVIAEPGLIRQTGTFATMVFGEADGGRSERGEKLETACRGAGFDVEFSEAIETRIWMKFLILVAMSGITSVTRKPVGELRHDPDIRRLYENAIAEAGEVGRRRGISLPEDAVAKQMAAVDNFPPEMVASMVHDLNGGKRLELDWLSGAVCRLGREAGVATPVHDTLYAALKPYKDGT